jgi:hypothetical protein
MRARPALITAVHEQDVIALLDLLDVGSKYRSGELHCIVCDTSLRERGLGAASNGLDGVVFACERLDCLEEFHAS